MSVDLSKRAAGRFTYYVWEDAVEATASANIFLVFVPFEQEDTSTMPGSTTVQATWSGDGPRGTYAFTRALPAEPEIAIGAIHDLRGLSANRWMWIENIDDHFGAWRRQDIEAEVADGKIPGFSFLDLNNFGLQIPPDTAVSYEPATPEQPENRFTFTAPVGEELLLLTDFGGHALPLNSPLHIPVAGTNAGSIQFGIGLPLEDLPDDPKGDQAFGYPEAGLLDIGFRLFFRDPALPAGEDGDIPLDSIRYPLFNEVFYNHEPDEIANGEQPDLKIFYPSSILLNAQWDLFDPLNQDRSYWKVSADHTTGIPSGFRTNVGATVHLKPTANSQLVFNLRPHQSIDEGTMSYYLAPKGDFELWVPKYKVPDDGATAKIDHDLVCGLGGVEYFRIAADGSTLLTFITNQGAFVENFISVSFFRQEVLNLVSHFTEIPLEELDPEQDFKQILDGEGNALFGDEEREKGTWEPLAAEFFPESYVLGERERLQLRNEASIKGGVNTPEQCLAWFTERLREIRTIDQPLSFSNLDNLARTSYAFVQMRGDENPVYYSQPDQALMYEDTTATGNDDIPQDEFLSFMEVPAYRVISGVEPASEKFPMLPYGGGLDEFYLEDYKQLEEVMLSAERQRIIQELDQLAASSAQADKRGLPASTKTAPQGTTPQGFLATYSQNFETIERLEMAKGTDGHSFRLTNIQREEPLRATLLSNQLFMVASNPQSFEAAITALPNDYKLDIDSWLFTMHPNLWDNYETLIVFKFHNQSMLELAKNPFSWSQPAHFSEKEAGRSQAETQKQLIRTLEDAIRKADSGVAEEEEKYGKLAQAARLPEWSGILALRVPIDRPPASIQGLMAGVDPAEFFATYIGIEVTPVHPVGDLLVADQSATFGLIDYENDQIPPPDESGYNFHVTKLFARFLNASLVDFSSEVAVVIDKLFDEKTRLVGSADGRNIIYLKGTVELREGEDIYSFRFEGDRQFQLPYSQAIRQVYIRRAEFVTDPAPVTATLVTSRFLFQGGLDFLLLPGFDILSFGNQDEDVRLLSFSQLQVIMDVIMPAEGAVDRSTTSTFRFDPGKLAFDLKDSKVRDNSLFAKFPLKFTGMTNSNGNQKFTDLGFMPVEVKGVPPEKPEEGADFVPPPPPLTSPKKITETDEPVNDWYALTWDLDLGTAGALAGSAGLVVSIVAAWIPQGMAPTPLNSGMRGVYVGLKLPGSSGGKKEIVIQGLIKIVFKKIQFIAGENNGDVAYLLKLKNIMLKFLVLSLPPNAQTEIIIFGDPDQFNSGDGSFDQDQKKLVGWYASYVKK